MGAYSLKAYQLERRRAARNGSTLLLTYKRYYLPAVFVG